MKIGPLELVVIFIVALLAIGPDKLPAYAQKLGQALREFRKVSADVTQDVRESVIEPLEEAQKPLREAIEPLEELNREVRKDIKDMERDFKNIGKAKPKAEEPPSAAPAPEEAEPQEPPKESPTVTPEEPEEIINGIEEGERI